MAVYEELKRRKMAPNSTSYTALIEQYAKDANIQKGLGTRQSSSSCFT